MTSVQSVEPVSDVDDSGLAPPPPQSSPPPHDVDLRQYPMVIREMIRHENDVTNHRLMWLLIVQGLIANAYVTAGVEKREITAMLALVAILVTLSAFVMLYKSYQARGYL